MKETTQMAVGYDLFIVVLRAAGDWSNEVLHGSIAATAVIANDPNDAVERVTKAIDKNWELVAVTNNGANVGPQEVRWLNEIEVVVPPVEPIFQIGSAGSLKEIA